MPSVPYRCSPDDAEICAGLEQIRAELEIPAGFGDDVLAEAEAVATRGPVTPEGSAATTVTDRTELEMVTIDPPDSMDLDQAYHGERTTSGWRVHYAIADVAAWVAPGGPIDLESQARGFTLYAPDSRVPLHPARLSEDAVSLLPGRDVQALLWTIDLDDEGRLTDATLERALVRSRHKLGYREAAGMIDAGEHPSLVALREIGERRSALEVERGAVSLQLAQQEVVADDTGFRLTYDESLPIENWNAQISLLTGIAAAEIMLDAKTGIVRTLPEPDRRTIRELRATARALGIDWPKDRTYPEVVRSLDPNDPIQAAMIAQSARGLRGAGYEAFDGELPEHTSHSAIAADYAHVTAPLRRLGDRYANECVLAAIADTAPPDWVLAVLPELPRTLGRARNREGNYERAIVDLVEAAILSGRVGETFTGLVTGVDEKKDRIRIQLRKPAVVAYADGKAELGEEVTVRLDGVDIESRRVRFSR